MAADSVPHSHQPWGVGGGGPVGGSRVGSALQLHSHKDSIWGDVPPSQGRGEAHAGQPFGKAESHSAPSQLSRPCGLTHLRTGQRPTAEVEGCLPRPGTQAPGGQEWVRGQEGLAHCTLPHLGKQAALHEWEGGWRQSSGWLARRAQP